MYIYFFLSNFTQVPPSPCMFHQLCNFSEQFLNLFPSCFVNFQLELMVIIIIYLLFYYYEDILLSVIIFRPTMLCCLSFCPFSSGHSVGCPSISDSDYPLCLFKLFLLLTYEIPNRSNRGRVSL